MKNSIFTAIILFLSVSYVFSQDAKTNYNLETANRFGIEITAGPSLPYGDFGKKDPYNESSGFAKLGFKVQANVSYHLIDVIDLNLMGFYNSNGTNLEEFQSLLARQYGGTWSAESRTWTIYGGMGGFEFNYPAFKKLTIGFRAYSGIMYSSAPEVKFTNGNNYLKQDEKTASSFAYIISLNAKYPLAKRLYWITSVDFLGASANFNNVKTTAFINNNTQVTTTSFSQDMRTIIFSTGLRIIL